MDFLSLDLAGSPSRPTGYAYWEDGVLKVGHVFEDKEILDLASTFSVVGIDAPLTLPKGRTSIEKRENAHFRECDLMLRQRKIRFFPITLGPMRKLTARGMALKEKISKAIEIFPGASYDVLGMGRKDKDELERFMEPFSVKVESQHQADAAIGWFTLWLNSKGYGEWLKGEDGSILLPKPAIYLGKKIEAEFINRRNRFVVETTKGLAYLRDTARLKHLLMYGTKLYLTPYKGKFKYMVKAAWNGKEWVMLDSLLDNKMFWLYMRSQGKILEKAKKQGNIVYDFWDGKRFYEVKGAHLFDGKKALFPDSYSARAFKHFSSIQGEIVFVAHKKACCVGINPAFKTLEDLIQDKPKWGISTAIVGRYWVFEKRIPFVI